MQDTDIATDKQSSSDYRRRLEKISRYYLGSLPDKKLSGSSAFLLPIIFDKDNRDFPLYAFTHSFKARGQPAQIFYPDHDTENLPDNIISNTADINISINICLVPVNDAELPLLKKCQRALITVPANHDGVCRAYIKLKHLLNINNNISTGIIMTHTKNQAMVRLYFDRLASGAQNFLGHHTTCFGYMLDGTATFSANHASDSIPVGLGNIADNIISDWMESPNTSPRTHTTCSNQSADVIA